MSSQPHARRTEEPVTLVSLRKVEAQRSSAVALTDITLDFPTRSVTAVVGPNGAGKSTLFAVVSRRLRPTSGVVDVRGQVAEVLQMSSIDAQLGLTVDDCVRMGRYAVRGTLRRFRRSDRELTQAAIERMSLGDLRRRRIGELTSLFDSEGAARSSEPLSQAVA